MSIEEYKPKHCLNMRHVFSLSSVSGGLPAGVWGRGGASGLTAAQELLAQFGHKRLQALKVPGEKLVSCVTL